MTNEYEAAKQRRIVLARDTATRLGAIAAKREELRAGDVVLTQHPRVSALLVVGLYDGSVLLLENEDRPGTLLQNPINSHDEDFGLFWLGRLFEWKALKEKAEIGPHIRALSSIDGLLTENRFVERVESYDLREGDAILAITKNDLRIRFLPHLEFDQGSLGDLLSGEDGTMPEPWYRLRTFEKAPAVGPKQNGQSKVAS